MENEINELLDEAFTALTPQEAINALISAIRILVSQQKTEKERIRQLAEASATIFDHLLNSE